MDILFATKNKHKLTEIRGIMDGAGYNILSMEEAGVDMDVEENGTTFEENAMIKAVALMEATGLLTLADDSGFEIDFLDGMPGVYSARYMGENTAYEIKNSRILELLSEQPDEKRKARFVCCIAAAFPDGRRLVARADVDGLVSREIRGAGGFGYDPIFYFPEYAMTMAELSMDEKNLISHRGKALRKMRDLLREAI